MKYLSILLLCVNFGAFAYTEANIADQIKNNSQYISKPKRQLIAEYIVQASKKYKICPRLFTAIIMQESSYKLNAINKICYKLKMAKNEQGPRVYCKAVDIGIAQINIKTIEAYKLNKYKLQSDLQYSINAGAKVLSWFTRYQKTEPKTWYCRYNVGTAAFPKIKSNCLKYKNSVARWM